MLNTILLAVLVGISGLSLLVGIFAIYLSLKAYIAIEAMKQSTHQVQYVDPFQGLDDEQRADMAKNEADLQKEYKEFNDQLIREGSEFADYDGDFKIV